jgi:cation transport ATPase
MNKKVKILTALTALLLIVFSGEAYSQEQQKTDTISIQTSAVCGMCKERLESKMAFAKGVTSVELDNKTKVLTVTYRPEKTTPEKLKSAVTKIGYDADEMPADQKAYEKLPACCKKDKAPH